MTTSIQYHITPALIIAAGLACAAAHAQTNPFPDLLDLAELESGAGFTLNGINAQDFTGAAVASLGDVNGDGIDDLLLGAYGVENNDALSAGAAYVVFGMPGGFPTDIPLSELDGTSGFRLQGLGEFRHAGAAVANAGDINGDGIHDLAIGAPNASYAARDEGAVYVIFGKNTVSTGPFPATIDLATLDDQTGFKIQGVALADRTGASIDGGADLNGDGIDDLFIGAPRAEAGPRLNAGATFVVFGRTTPFPSTLPLDTLDGQNGIRIDGAGVYHSSGAAVAGSTDLNGDGLDDLVIGAPGVRVGAMGQAGATFVVFGRAPNDPFPALMSLADLDAPRGLVINGAAAYDRSGSALASSADINGDGLGDIAIGAYSASPDGLQYAGASFVVFGRPASDPFPASLSLADLDGNQGFRINGILEDHWSGHALASPGDLNGDGLEDLAIGAPGDNIARVPGSAFVLYGKPLGNPFPPTLSLADLSADVGFRIDGAQDRSRAAFALSGGGDINVDGQPDLLIGAPEANVEDEFDAGQAYVVYGRSQDPPCRADLDGDGELTLFDFLAFQNAFDARDPIADFDADGEFTLFDFLAFQNEFDAGCV